MHPLSYFSLFSVALDFVGTCWMQWPISTPTRKDSPEPSGFSTTPLEQAIPGQLRWLLTVVIREIPGIHHRTTASFLRTEPLG